MTVNDMLEQFEIYGALRVQAWDDNIGDMQVYYDTDGYDNALINREDEWLWAKIKSIYPSETEDGDGGEISQVIIEIELI